LTSQSDFGKITNRKKSHMKTTIQILTLTTFTLTASAQIATNVTITNIASKVYSGITLDHTNNCGFVWKAKDGSMGQLKYSDLPADVLARYQVSSDTVRAAQEAQTKANTFSSRQTALARTSALIQTATITQVPWPITPWPAPPAPPPPPYIPSPKLPPVESIPNIRYNYPVKKHIEKFGLNTPNGPR
jgi:hypothetical protein